MLAFALVLLHASSVAAYAPPPLLPGLNNIGLGVDLATFTPINQDGTGPGQGVKMPLVNLTCAGEEAAGNCAAPGSSTVTMWNRSFTTYDQVATCVAESKATTDYTLISFNDTFDFSAKMSETVDGSALFGLFSASEEMSAIFDAGVKVAASLYIVFGDVDDYIARLKPPFEMQPSADFVESARRIPEDWWWPTNWAIAQEHISYFGTHYLNEIKADGQYRYSSYVSSAYIHAAGQGKAAAEAGADFLGLLSLDATGAAAANASNDFLANVTLRRVSCLGGNENCHGISRSPAVYNAWAESVKDEPWIVSARYTNAAELFAATGPDRLLRSKIQLITEAHLAWKGLERFVALVEAARAEMHVLANLAAPPPRPKNCSRMLNGNDPYVIVPRVKANAAALFNRTSILHEVLNATLASRATDARVASWMTQVGGWATSIKELLEAAFSLPLELEVITAESTTYLGSPLWAQLFGCLEKDNVKCCWEPPCATCLTPKMPLSPCSGDGCKDGCICYAPPRVAGQTSLHACPTGCTINKKPQTYYRAIVPSALARNVTF